MHCGTLAEVESAIANGIDLNQERQVFGNGSLAGEDGYSLLHYAASNGYADAVTRLLECDASVTQLSASGKVGPIHLASQVSRCVSSCCPTVLACVTSFLLPHRPCLCDFLPAAS
jgi:hypothetical protein